MLGSPCHPCCGCGGPYPITDPAGEGTWVPSGSWRTGVTWTLQPNTGNANGNSWFFWGNAATSKNGGTSNPEDWSDWTNICNWWSVNTNTLTPALFGGPSASRRASRLPDENSVVFIYGPVSLAKAPNAAATVKTAYFFTNNQGGIYSGLFAGTLTTTHPVLDSTGGAIFSGTSSANFATIDGGATFVNSAHNKSLVNGGATFNSSSYNDNQGVVNGGATLNDGSYTMAGSVVNGGGTFTTGSENYGVVNGGGTFVGTRNLGTVNGGASYTGGFNNGTINDGAVFVNGQNGGIINGGAVFNQSAYNIGQGAKVYGGATFNNYALNYFGAQVYGGAVFNNFASNQAGGLVYGGATFNDAACTTGVYLGRFAAHPTDIPTCNGTALPYAQRMSTVCGCG